MEENKLFAVIIATYKRPDNSTRTHLSNVADMLSRQTCQDFHVFLMGDDYEDDAEFEEMVGLFPKHKITAKNFKKSFRTYNLTVFNKWTVGGTLARFEGIKQAIFDGYQFYAHLDDDDTWSENHLQLFKETFESFPEVDFMYTRSDYMGGITLPRVDVIVNEIKYGNLNPTPGHLVNSSTCINLKRSIIYDIINVFTSRFALIEKFQSGEIREHEMAPFDMEKWLTIRNKYKCIFRPETTCHKPTDGNRQYL